MLLSVPSKKVSPVGLVADVDQDGRTLGDDLIAVDEVGKVGRWVDCKMLGLVLLEPLVLVVLIVEDLVVGEGSVLKEESDAFCESPDGPVADD